jgi:dihydrodipicolinate synthase/N-acetylneuraminate lyase
MTLKFTVESLNGVIAIAPTPARPGADDFRNLDTVDLKESERLIRSFVADGVDGILTNGTFGEMATLTFDEWKAFTTVVVETVRGAKADLPLFIGATTLNTRDTVARIKFLHDLGARGVFLGRPMWCELGPQAMLTFYKDVASAFPDVSFVLYDNPEAFKGAIPTEVLAALAENPQFIGVKYGPLGEKYRTDLKAVAGRIRLMPLEMFWARTFEAHPTEATACWSSIAPCGPAPIVYLRDALRRDDMEAARWVSGRIMWSHETHLAGKDFHEFAKYNIPIDKARFNAAGYVNAGPARPPYHVAPQEYIDGATEVGRRWRLLIDEVRGRTKLTPPLKKEA